MEKVYKSLQESFKPWVHLNKNNLINDLEFYYNENYITNKIVKCIVINNRLSRQRIREENKKCATCHNKMRIISNIKHCSASCKFISSYIIDENECWNWKYFQSF